MKNTYDMEHVVPIPEGSHLCKDGRLYIVAEKRYFPSLRYNMDKKIWVGRDAGNGKMHPSREYREHFPAAYKAAVPELFYPDAYKKVGLFVVVLSIAIYLKLYRILVKSFGTVNANLIMDYSVSMIRNNSNVVTTLETDMVHRVIFLDRLYSDAWIGERLTNITSGQIHHFYNAWIKQCVKLNINEVWLCIDGSNSDYAVSDTEMGEKGKAKSGKNRNIVGFMYAVTEGGIPVYGRIYRGGRVDSKELIEIISFLREHGIKVKGIILDRGFCEIECFRLLDDCNYTYVIMLKENTVAYKHMVQEYASKLKLSWENALGGSHYGTTEAIKVFKKYEKLSNVALIWDSKNGVERSESLIDKAQKEIARLRTHLCDAEKPVVAGEFKKLISIVPVVPQKNLQQSNDTQENKTPGDSTKEATIQSEVSQDENATQNASAPAEQVNNSSELQKESLENEGSESSELWKIVIDHETLQTAIEGKGFYALASSDMNMTAKEMDDTYNIRDVSEKQNSRVKTQLGSKALRGHSDENNIARFLVSFVGSCIRNEFEKACGRLNLDVNKAIKELDHLLISLGSQDEYYCIHDESGYQLDLLRELKLIPSDLDDIAAIENRRITTNEEVTVHKIPRIKDDDDDDEDEVSNKENDKQETSTMATTRINDLPQGSKAKGKGQKKKKDKAAIDATSENR